MTVDEFNGFEKPYRVTIWRVSKGYVRYQVHADNIENAVHDWITLGRLLREEGELIEGHDPEVQDER